MIEVTEAARKKLKESLIDEGDNPAVRIYVAGVG